LYKTAAKIQHNLYPHKSIPYFYGNRIRFFPSSARFSNALGAKVWQSPALSLLFVG
jgi:hypothetical protein